MSKAKLTTGNNISCLNPKCSYMLNTFPLMNGLHQLSLFQLDIFDMKDLSRNRLLHLNYHFKVIIPMVIF